MLICFIHLLTQINTLVGQYMMTISVELSLCSLICVLLAMYTHILCSHGDSYHLFVSILLILHIICIVELAYLYTILKVKPVISSLMVDKIIIVQLVFALKGCSI